jgi:hypothetical protein
MSEGIIRNWIRKLATGEHAAYYQHLLEHGEAFDQFAHKVRSVVCSSWKMRQTEGVATQTASALLRRTPASSITRASATGPGRSGIRLERGGWQGRAMSEFEGRRFGPARFLRRRKPG